MTSDPLAVSSDSLASTVGSLVYVVDGILPYFVMTRLIVLLLPIKNCILGRIIGYARCLLVVVLN